MHVKTKTHATIVQCDTQYSLDFKSRMHFNAIFSKMLMMINGLPLCYVYARVPCVAFYYGKCQNMVAGILRWRKMKKNISLLSFLVNVYSLINFIKCLFCG